MADVLTIHYPRKPEHKRIPRNKFVAVGTALPEAGPLFGILVGDQGTTVSGITVRDPPAYPRWLLFFHLRQRPEKGEKFTLCILRRTFTGGEVLAKVSGIEFPTYDGNKGVGIDFPG